MYDSTAEITAGDTGGLTNIDTSFVLFFLAMETGRGQGIGADAIMMGFTTLIVLVLPYFLPSAQERTAFSSWLTGRAAIALLGLVLGAGLRQAVGVVLPDGLINAPMTLLIFSAMVSCYIQFYSLMKLRPAK